VIYFAIWRLGLGDEPPGIADRMSNHQIDHEIAKSPNSIAKSPDHEITKWH
jgi:hypothetical protein